MFDRAKPAPKPAAKGKKKKEIKISGLLAVAAFDAVIKSMTAIKETMAATIKEGPMTDHFVAQGMLLKRTPESFTGVEGNAKASCELRKRSTSSVLSPEEVETLEAKGIPVETIVTTVETYRFNEKHLADPLLMAKIEKALSGIKGLPEDLLFFQEGVSKQVVADDAIDTLFRDITDEDTVREILPLITVQAIKPTMVTDDSTAAFSIVNEIMNPPKKEKTAK